MANIPFASYPSFANVSRFEHSIGVAHLAWRFAQSQQLAEDEALALTLAGLYHDGASPAFGHLYEEMLVEGGFDHEVALVELLTGTSDLNGKADAQIFLGRRCRLPRKLPLAEEGTVLSCQGISQILGRKHRLSPAIVGSLDLDNIDNVIRAATAMGIAAEALVHPYEVLADIAIEKGEVRRVDNQGSGIGLWQDVRKRLYDAILGNTFEFRAQTAIKWAISEAAKCERELAESASWTLTEPELVFDHLRRYSTSRRLVDSVRLGSPPEAVLIMRARDITSLLDPGGGERMKALCERVEPLVGYPVFCNFYKDKTERMVTLPGVEQSHTSSPTTPDSPGVVGLFRGWRDDETYSRRRHGPQRADKEALESALIEQLSLEPAAPQRTDVQQLTIAA
jgi:HD superfamily phosphohydrolases